VAARVLSPTSHIAKTYHVQISALADEPLLNALRAGVREGDDFLRVECVRELRRGNVMRGWNCPERRQEPQIRRMLEALGIEVLRLVRVAIGGLQLGGLARESPEAECCGKGALRSETKQTTRYDVFWRPRLHSRILVAKGLWNL